jgi:D-Tyr-tRNAtyr deacylase
VIALVQRVARAEASVVGRVATARALHPAVACGAFGADMQVSLVNDGPVTMPITLRR